MPEMPVDFDEIAVKAMLHDAVTGQPQAPTTRARAVRARIVRHRIRMGAIVAANAGLVIALVVGLAVALGPGRHQVPVSHPPRPSWALPWPDHRDGSVPQRVLDQAVLAWRHLTALADQPGLAPVSGKIAWYVGQKAANGHMVAVVFETQTPSGPRLVAGKAVASEVMNGQPGWSEGSTPWVLYNVPAPRPVPRLVLSLNLSGATRTPNRSPDDWVLVLASPQAWSVSYNLYAARGVFGAPSGTTHLIGGGGALLKDGFAEFDVGQITARVVLTRLLIGNRNALPAPVPVGIPGSSDSQVPQLEIAGPVTMPTRFIMALEFTGQGAQVDSATSLVGGNLTFVARCFGDAPLRLRFRASSRPSSLGPIPCDDRSHVLRTAVTVTRGQNLNDLLISTSQLTSYRIAIGVIK